VEAVGNCGSKTVGGGSGEGWVMDARGLEGLRGIGQRGGGGGGQYSSLTVISIPHFEGTSNEGNTKTEHSGLLCTF